MVTEKSGEKAITSPTSTSSSSDSREKSQSSGNTYEALTIRGCSLHFPNPKKGNFLHHDGVEGEGCGVGHLFMLWRGVEGDVLVEGCGG